MSVYRVFNSSDLMSLFYRVYLCFLLDLRRTNNKHNCIFQLFHFVYLIKKCSVFIFKMFYHISFKLNIVNFSKALPPPVSSLNPSRNSQPRTTATFYFPIHTKRRFFPFLANSLVAYCEIVYYSKLLDSCGAYCLFKFMIDKSCFAVLFRNVRNVHIKMSGGSTHFNSDFLSFEDCNDVLISFWC